MDIEKNESVNHPWHYQRKGMDAICVLDASGWGFNLGNTIKYLVRAYKKGDRLTDLKKALWYLKRESGAVK